MSAKVVGEGAQSPTCQDIFFAILFLANTLTVLVFFFTWIADVDYDFLGDLQESIPEGLGSASALTATYSFIFCIIFLFLYLLVMKIFSYVLIIGLNVALILVTFITGVYAIANADQAEEYSGDSDAYWWSVIVGILLIITALLMSLWLWCIRARIEMTAKMLAQVAGVLFVVPGVMTISYLLALVVVFWFVIWGPATLQANIWLANANDGTLPWTCIFVDAAMLLSGFWTYQVLNNISTVTTAGVVASWYFQPSTAEDGIPCFRPIVFKSFCRAMTYFLGPIAFGSLLVAIIQAIYWMVHALFEKFCNGENLLIRMVACCVLCLINCLKNCIEWLSEFAYVYVAVYGSSFFEAGKQVFSLLGAAGLTAITNTTLISPVLYLGRFLGSAIGVGAGFLALQSYPLDSSWYWLMPVCGSVLGFCIVSCGLTCVEAGMNTLLVCFADDPKPMEERAAELHGLISEHVKPAETGTKGDPVLARP